MTNNLWSYSCWLTLDVTNNYAFFGIFRLSPKRAEEAFYS